MTRNKISFAVLAIITASITSQAQAGDQQRRFLGGYTANYPATHTWTQSAGYSSYPGGTSHYGPGTQYVSGTVAATPSPKLGLNVDQMSDGRLVVNQVMRGYAAERAGVRVGDQILKFNGRTVRTFTELRSILQRATGRVSLTVLRTSGRVGNIIIDMGQPATQPGHYYPSQPIQHHPGHYYPTHGQTPVQTTNTHTNAKLIQLMNEHNRVNRMRLRLGMRPITFQAFLAAKSAATKPPVSHPYPQPYSPVHRANHSANRSVAQ